MNYKEKFKNLRRTPWFLGSTKPAYEGVYERYFGLSDRIVFQYWDGKVWWASWHYWIVADTQFSIKSAHQDTKLWRGCSFDTTKS